MGGALVFVPACGIVRSRLDDIPVPVGVGVEHRHADARVAGIVDHIFGKGLVSRVLQPAQVVVVVR